MKRKRIVLLVAAMAIVPLGTVAAAEPRLETEQFLDPAWLANGYDPAELVTYRVYVNLSALGSEAQLIAVGDLANDGEPLLFESWLGSFFNSNESGAGDGPPLDLRAQGIWEPQWDTFVTMGEATYTGAAPIVQFAAGFPKQAAGLAGNFALEDTGWLAPSGVAQDGDGRVLVAQLTFPVDCDFPQLADWVVSGRLAAFDPFQDVVSALGPLTLPECPADLDSSHTIGFGDLSILLNAWGQPGTAPLQPDPDIDGSGFVGFGDLTRLLETWGPCCY